MKVAIVGGGTVKSRLRSFIRVRLRGRRLTSTQRTVRGTKARVGERLAHTYRYRHR